MAEAGPRIRVYLELRPDEVHSGTQGLRVAFRIGWGTGGPSPPAALALFIPHGCQGLHHALVRAHILQLVPHQLHKAVSLPHEVTFWMEIVV